VLLKIIRGPVTNSILNHTGLLTFSSIDALLAKFKFVSQEYDIRFAVYKKVLTVMIESLENVCKYTMYTSLLFTGNQSTCPPSTS
jgi:hypothetical protein